MAEKTIMKLVMVILVLFGIALALFFAWPQVSNLISPDSTFACEVGLPTCKRVQATESAEALVVAIKCAYFRCTEGCDSQNVNFDAVVNVKNRQDLTLNCKRDLCLPYKDKDNRVCGKNNALFAVRVKEKSVLATSFFFDKRFDEIKVEKTCEAKKPITLEENVVYGNDPKKWCKEKECELKLGIYYLWSERGRTATCNLPDDNILIEIPEFTFSIEPTTLSDKQEFILTFPDIPQNAFAIQLILDEAKYEIYEFNRNLKSIKLKVGEAIPARSGSLQLKAYRAVFDSKDKQYNNLVGISKPIKIEVKKAS